MEFQNFCFAYKKREPESLHIPSAELPVGETIAIIGLNGAGKSTLARCICGLEKKCGLLQVDGKTLDWKEYLKFAEVMMDKPIAYYAFEVLYWCGIREGELLALTPADFDFTTNTVPGGAKSRMNQTA